MFLKIFSFLLVCLPAIIGAVNITTISNGNWEDASTWSNNQVPTNPDSIIIKHYVSVNQDFVISSPSVLYITSAGTICGDFLMTTLCGAKFINFGHIYLGSIKTKHGLNYNVLQSKNFITLTGCSPPAGGFNNYQPNGTTQVWPPVFCKTINTNWELGTPTEMAENDNAIEFLFQNPIYNNSIIIKAKNLSYFNYKIKNFVGSTVKSGVFSNQLELQINDLPNGMYFLEIQHDEKFQIKKIIKISF